MRLGGGARQWTAEVRAWPWACPLFLFFATGLGASSIRYGVPAFPLIWSFVERTDSEVDRKVQLAFALGLAAGGYCPVDVEQERHPAGLACSSGRLLP